MTRRSDPNPAYWEQYGPFQHVKHELIRCYLNGWFPKLGTWAGRVLYVDTHAGRGRYESGDPGSPLVALQTLLNHSYRDKLLTASEFNFLFIERDPANLAALETELDRLRPLPARVNVSTSEGDAFERLSSILGDLRRDRARMAPAFERWQDLHAAVRPEWWLPKHVNEVVRDLKKDGTIAADAVPGRKFGAAASPLLRLARSGGGRPRK